MIIRQRQNLRRTFAANELGRPTTATVKRITTTEEELLDATAEFALGAARFGPAPELDDAAQAMKQAVASLQNQDLADGQVHEQQALAALVRARKNFRQLLSMSSSSSASQCRNFDQQQRQKLRPPNDRKKKEQTEQQVAEMREDLDQLAQQQRQWSEDVRSRSGGVELQRDPPDQNQSSPSSNPSGQNSQGTQQQQQQQAAAQANRLREQMRNSEVSSDLAQQRMDAAAEAIQRSLDELKAGETEGAAETAAAVAERLEELSEHLAALNAADFAEQLGHAQRLAQRLADEQQVVSHHMQDAAQGNGSGEAATAVHQRAIAGGAEMLEDLLARTSAAALEEDRETQEALDELKATNPPRVIAQTMDEAADDFEAGSFAPAAQSAESARQDVGELADSLRQARQQYSQPRLDELMEAEQDVADLIEALKDSESSGLVDSRLADLEQQIEALSRRDSRLAKALSASGSSAEPGSEQKSASTGGDGTTSGNGQLGTAQPSSFNRPPTVMGRGLRDVSKVLQTRIQEVILASVRMDADGAVPPEYRELVERYYRELSEDLR